MKKRLPEAILMRYKHLQGAWQGANVLTEGFNPMFQRFWCTLYLSLTLWNAQNEAINHRKRDLLWVISKNLRKLCKMLDLSLTTLLFTRSLSNLGNKIMYCVQYIFFFLLALNIQKTPSDYIYFSFDCIFWISAARNCIAQYPTNSYWTPILSSISSICS